MSWPMVPLGEVAEFIRGVTYKPADLTPNFAEGSVVCMRTSNVQATLDESDMKSIPEQLVGHEKKILKEGDLLVSTANSWNLVGKCCWVPVLSYRATAGGFIAILRGDTSKLDQRYLYHWFSSPNTQADARNCGRQTTNISNMDIGRCLKLELPIPPLPEQRRIAAILDKADALRAKRRLAIAKLDQLLQSVFLEMFGDPVTNPKGWPKAKMGQLVKFTGGSQPEKKHFIDHPAPGYVRLVQIRDFRTDRYPTYVPAALTKRRFQRSDVMIGRYGPPVFQIFRGLEGAYNVALMKAEPREGIISEYLFYLLSSSSIQTLVIANSQRSAGQSGVNLDFLEEIPLGTPPLDLQKRFAALSETIEQLRIPSERQTHEIERMFAAAQSLAFGGSL